MQSNISSLEKLSSHVQLPLEPIPPLEHMNTLSSGIHEFFKFAPPHRLYKALAAAGVLDFYGNVHPYYHSLTETTIEILNRNIGTYLNTVKVLKVDILDLDIRFSLGELFAYLSQIEPGIAIEILQENALAFVGYEGIEETFKSWGLSIEEICGKEYVEQLKDKLNQLATHLSIQYYVKNSTPEKIANLKRAVLEYIAFKIHIKPDNKNFPIIKQALIKALLHKENRSYGDWLEDFEMIDHYIVFIAVDELVVKEQKELHCKENEYFSGLKLEFSNQESVQIQFSRRLLSKKLRYVSDKIHLPLTYSLNSTQFIKHDDSLIHGMLDMLCYNKTPIPSDLIRLKEGIMFLRSMSDGQLYRTGKMQSTIACRVLEILREKCKTEPPLHFGEALGQFVLKACFQYQNNEKVDPHAAISVTMAACEMFMGIIYSEELQEMIKYVAPFWRSLREISTETSPYFSYLSYLLDTGISYPLISLVLRIQTFNLISEENKPVNTRAWFNEIGWEGKSNQPQFIENVVQLELINKKRSFYITLLQHPFETALQPNFPENYT